MFFVICLSACLKNCLDLNTIWAKLCISPSFILQGKELLAQKIPMWQQACAEPNKLPDRAMFLAQQMSGAAGVMVPGAHHPGMPISEPIPGAKPLPVPPELAALRAGGGMGQQVCPSLTLPKSAPNAPH